MPLVREESLAKRTAKNLFSGFLGGAANCITGHPFDTLKVCSMARAHLLSTKKYLILFCLWNFAVLFVRSAQVRLQTQPVNKPLYNGLLDCFLKTVRQEGLGGLYRGVGMSAMDPKTLGFDLNVENRTSEWIFSERTFLCFLAGSPLVGQMFSRGTLFTSYYQVWEQRKLKDSSGGLWTALCLSENSTFWLCRWKPWWSITNPKVNKKHFPLLSTSSAVLVLVSLAHSWKDQLIW